MSWTKAANGHYQHTSGIEIKKGVGSNKALWYVILPSYERQNDGRSSLKEAMSYIERRYLLKREVNG